MKKLQKIAVETLTLKELSKLFRDSLEIGFARAEKPLLKMFNDLNRAKISNYQWIKSYEIFKGAKLNFYCKKVPGQKGPLMAIGMTYRTSKGMVLIVLDTNNGGTIDSYLPGEHDRWDDWIFIYTGHCCERYAERIMKAPHVTFKTGSEGIMFSDMNGIAKIGREQLHANVDEITFQFKEGQSYGYRDRKNKITLFRTIYSNDMLKGERLDLKAEWETSTQDLKELFSLD